jgi:hypothetical protein
LTGFWLATCGVALLAFLVCRKWARFAFVVLPLSVVFPYALASAEGPLGARFPAVQAENVLGACALVLIANLVGMRLGKYRFVFYTLYPGRKESATERVEDRRS